MPPVDGYALTKCYLNTLIDVCLACQYGTLVFSLLFVNW